MSVSPPPTETVIAGRYELRRRLAQGGMAEVWLAIDLTLDRKVAVKWLKQSLAGDEVVAERFRREAVAAASLNHPNIVAVHDVFEHEGRQAVVMQLVDGKSLRQLLDTQRRLSPELTAHIGTCVAAALDHAHRNNFVHRDVKPGNIMITSDGRVLLTDFGIAKALGGGDDLTNDNIMMGTAKYLSPEQVRGKKLDGRADLYSLGLVLYECLAGRVPFLGETDADTALARLQRDPTDLSRLRATLPTGLVTIIHQLLARNPLQRPASGAELISALDAARNEPAPVIDETDHGERSPVAPFSRNRLLRAPSDLAGRARDRRRASRGRPNRRHPDDDADAPTTAPATAADRAADGDTPRGAGAAPAAPSSSSSASDPSAASEPAPVPRGRDGIVSTSTAATRPPAAGPGQRRIPGEPDRITGSVAVTGADTTRTPVVRPPVRERTPTNLAAPESQVRSARATVSGASPASADRSARPRTADDDAGRAGVATSSRTLGGIMQGRRTSLVVLGGLIAVALLIAAILWVTTQLGDGTSSAPTTVLPAGAAPDAAAADETTDPGDPNPTETSIDPSTPLAIASISTYDPDGDGEENDATVTAALADGDPSTAWRTVCYGSRYMGGKTGVGVVVSLDNPGRPALSVDVVNGPYIVEFYATPDEQIPVDFAGWGTRVGERAFDSAAETVVSDIPPIPVRHILVVLNELGPDSACTADNPYRGGFGEIALLG